MEQDNDIQTGGEGASAPTPFGDILRDTAPMPGREPAGRQEPLPTTAAPVETGDKPEQQAPTDTRPRDEGGRFAPKDANAAPETGTPPAEQKAPQTVPIAVVLEERKKRQALEARIAEFEARQMAPAAQIQPQKPAAPEIPLEDLMFQDPQRFIEQMRQPMVAELAQTRIALSETVARQNADYADAEAALVEFANANPDAKAHIRQMLLTHPAPAMWALDQGRQLLAQQKWGSVTQQYGSPEAFLAAHQQQAPQPVAQPPAPPATPPGSLASVRSAGPRNGPPAWNGPTPLSAILAARR